MTDAGQPNPINRNDQPAVDPSAPGSPALWDADTSNLTLVGETASLSVGRAITTCALDRTIDGASSLTATLNDPDLAILNSVAIKGKGKGTLSATTVLENQSFALAGLNLLDQRQLRMTTEALAVHLLRKQIGALTMTRSQHNTRARFFKRLCDDAGVPFVCPELEKPQPIQTQAQFDAAKKNSTRSPGFAANAKLEVAGMELDASQVRNADIVLGVATSHHAGPVATLALVEACIVEPGPTIDNGGAFSNPPGGDGTSEGILQVLKSTAQSLGINPLDIAQCCATFLDTGFTGKGGAIAIARSQGVLSAGGVAQAVQGSAFPTRYALYQSDAQKIIDAYTGASPDVLTGATTVEQPYQFARGKTEDSWTCMRRLAAQVGWYLFEVNGEIHYYSPGYLMATRSRMTVSPGAPGIDKVTFGYFTSPRYADTVIVTCRARAWDGEPGTVATVTGYGPIDDAPWLTTDINRASMASATTVVTLGRPQKTVPEPAPTTVANPAQVGADRITGGTLRERVVAAAAKAAMLSAADPTYYHYSEPGIWKYDLFLRDAPNDRSDCSSFVIQCFYKAGCVLPASMTGQGNTETLISVGRKTSDPQLGDVCLYGPSVTDTHHCELLVSVDPLKTIGHGSPPIDYDTPTDPTLVAATGGFLGYYTFAFLDAPA